METKMGKFFSPVLFGCAATDDAVRLLSHKYTLNAKLMIPTVSFTQIHNGSHSRYVPSWMLFPESALLVVEKKVAFPATD